MGFWLLLLPGKRNKKIKGENTLKFNMTGGGGLVKPLKKKTVKKTAPSGATLPVENHPSEAGEKSNGNKYHISSTEVLKPDGNVNFEDKHTVPTPEEKLSPALMQSSLTTTGQKFERSDPIVASRYCYGCLRSSIAKFGTTQEKFWCERDPDDKGVVNFVLVKKTYTIAQCKYRVEEDIPF